MLTRAEVHEIIDRQLDEWKYGDVIFIKRGMIGFEIQMENGEVTLESKERHRKQVIKK